MNIHEPIDLATGQSVIVEQMTIELLDQVETGNPTMTSIYVVGKSLTALQIGVRQSRR